MRRPLSLILIALALPVSAAEPVQSLDSIRTTVQERLRQDLGRAGGDLEVTLGRLDPRLRLQRCGEALRTFYPNGPARLGNNTLGVRCPGPRPWTLYVPASGRRYAEVMVLARPVTRGTPIAAEDVRRERRDLTRLVSGYYRAPGEVVGKLLRRSVAVGQVLNGLQVVSASRVRRGQRVTLLARTGSLEVRVSGKALADAAVGERVRVRNLGSKRIVEGTVEQDGTVRVRL